MFSNTGFSTSHLRGGAEAPPKRGLAGPAGRRHEWSRPVPRPPRPSPPPCRTPPAPAAVPPVLLTPREAADALGISVRTLREWSVPKGSIPPVRLGRLTRYRRADLEAFAHGNRVTAGASGKSR